MKAWPKAAQHNTVEVLPFVLILLIYMRSSVVENNIITAVRSRGVVR